MRSLFLPLSRNSPSVNSRPSSKNDVCSTSLWEVRCGQTDFLLGYLSCLSPPSKTTVAWTSELSHSPCGWHEKERTHGEKRMFSKSENRLKWTLFRKRFVIIRCYEILKFWKLNICSTCPDVPVCVCVLWFYSRPPGPAACLCALILTVAICVNVSDCHWRSVVGVKCSTLAFHFRPKGL